MDGQAEPESDATDHRVFVSYSRTDAPLVDELDDVLREAGVDSWIDRGELRLAEPWRAEIRESIDRSDGVVFAISKASVESIHCLEELEYARSAGKKVLPVVVGSVQPDSLQKDRQWLVDLHWIALRPGRTEEVAHEIALAVQNDYEWTKYHTELTRRARDWEGSDRKRSKLLRGSDLAEALSAIATQRPNEQATIENLHKEYVEAGRRFRVRTRVALAMLSVVLPIALVIGYLSWSTVTRERRVDQAQELWDQAERSQDIVSSVELAVEAGETVRESDLPAPQIAGPLLAALSRADVPFASFNASDRDPSPIKVTSDGRAFAYLGTDSAIHIVDSSNMHEESVIELEQLGAGFSSTSSSMALGPTAESVAVFGSSSQSDGLRLAILRSEGGEWTTAHDETVSAGISPVSIHFGGDPTVVSLVAADGTVAVVDLSGPTVTVTNLGEPAERIASQPHNNTVSIDGNRICTQSGTRLQVFQVAPPIYLGGSESAAKYCVPEGCEANIANVLAFIEGRWGCQTPDGGRVGEEEVAGDHPARDRTAVPAGSGSWTSSSGWFMSPLRRGLMTAEALVTVGSGVFESSVDSLPYLVSHHSGPALLHSDGISGVHVTLLNGGVLPTTEEPQVLRAGLADLDVVVPRRDLGVSSIVAGLRRQPDGWAVVVDDTTQSDELVLPSDGDLSDILLAEYIGPSQLVVVSDNGSIWFADLEALHAGAVKRGAPGEGDVLADRSGSAQVSGTRLAVIDQDGTAVEVWNATDEGLQFDWAASLSSPQCLVGFTPSGDHLALVSCGPSSQQLSIVERDNGTGPTSSVPLPFEIATAVSISDDGSVAVVSFGAGEVAVLRDSDFIQPDDLTVATPSHPMYVPGWAAVSGSGEWLVTRRDSAGMKLWYLGGEVVEEFATLTSVLDYEMPRYVSFGEHELRIISGQTVEPILTSWPISFSAATAVASSLVDPSTVVGEADQTDIVAGPTVGSPDPTIVQDQSPPTVDTDNSELPSLRSEAVTLVPGQYYSIGAGPDGAIWVGGIGQISQVASSGERTAFDVNGDHVQIGAGSESGVWTSNGISLYTLFDDRGWQQLSGGGGAPFHGLWSDGVDVYVLQYIGSESGRIASVCRLLHTSTNCEEVAAYDDLDLEVTRVTDFVGRPDGGFVVAEAPRYVDSPEEGALHLVADGQPSRYPLGSGSMSPGEVAIDSAGKVWFTVLGEELVGSLDVDGEISLFPLPAGIEGRDIAVDHEERVLVLSQTGLTEVGGAGEIRYFDLSGSDTNFVALVVDASGASWLLDDGSDELLKVEFG